MPVSLILGPALVCGPRMAGAAMDMAAVSADWPFSLVTFVTFPEILVFQ